MQGIRPLTYDEIASIFADGYDTLSESEMLDYGLDALLEALDDDYNHEGLDKEKEPTLFEKAYKQGWDDAIQHIQEFLNRTVLRKEKKNG